MRELRFAGDGLDRLEGRPLPNDADHAGCSPSSTTAEAQVLTCLRSYLAGSEVGEVRHGGGEWEVSGPRCLTMAAPTELGKVARR
ncbi:hypothetical protein BDW02DRAFT_233020 [Decorospora gaudefroyi]|uniref:Uncharacterized protein n=1 Tax=Decorospora gaudefroyi TaxID=184978 RepID=A0A6A5KPW2_9PLEO|nr:hypothetical protein BDW02DRAFT_233020 [Decorospora gaudefroyi]